MILLVDNYINTLHLLKDLTLKDSVFITSLDGEEPCGDVERLNRIIKNHGTLLSGRGLDGSYIGPDPIEFKSEYAGQIFKIITIC